VPLPVAAEAARHAGASHHDMVGAEAIEATPYYQIGGHQPVGKKGWCLPPHPAPFLLTHHQLPLLIHHRLLAALVCVSSVCHEATCHLTNLRSQPITRFPSVDRPQIRSRSLTFGATYSRSNEI
jgi:hypothetical protein